MSTATPMADLLMRRIAKTGPISLAQYMSDCLLHPEHGYYTTRDPLGAQGDFTTAPEISQMFGEMIGLCLAQSWIDQGKPASFTLAELGPGRGTLMADILRATANISGLHAAMHIVLVEASPVLQSVQATALTGYNPIWVSAVTELPQAPLFLVANEFFDTLPIRQFARDPHGWRETHVGLSGEELIFGLSSPAPIALLDHRLHDTQPNDVVEICPSAAPIIDEIASRITQHGGAALLIDYGDWHSTGDTFQALEAHEMVSPLARPGCADLTAHVDFEALSQHAQSAGAYASAMTPQGLLLARLGIEQRAERLASNMNHATLENHRAAFERLTSPQKMGTLFKAIAITQTAKQLPPGFDPAP